jgi:hypothetical protein
LLDLGVRDWIMAQRCLGDGSYAIIGPYLAEVWPAGLRTSGMGLDSGVGNLGKIRGPLGLFLIVGASNSARRRRSTLFSRPGSHVPGKTA